MRPAIVVLGIGNPYRRDDGVASEVLAEADRVGPRHVRYVELDGEPARLIEAWAGADLAIVVDACRTGAPPGTVHRLDPMIDPVADRVRGDQMRGVSGHGLGLVAAIRLGAALDRLPDRLRVVAVEAGDLREGTGLSPGVAAAVPAAVRAVLDDVRSAGQHAWPGVRQRAARRSRERGRASR